MPPSALFRASPTKGGPLEFLRLLLSAVCRVSALDVAQKLALVYVALQLTSFVRTRPWVAKHRLPADVQALLGSRELPDPELFPQYFTSPSTGLWLYSRQWIPLTPARGVIFVVPGMGEHTGRYEFLASSMTKLGLAVFSLDHQHTLAKHADYAELPRFLFGHSLGGAISILLANETLAFSPSASTLVFTTDEFISEDDAASKSEDGAIGEASPPLRWTGVILSAPAIVPDPKVKTPLKVIIGKALASFLPKVSLAPLPASGISTNLQVHNLYRTDPLIYHGGVQVRWGMETLRALDSIHATIESARHVVIKDISKWISARI
ncbi:hypothetical protein T492DRAFT_970674 [Pavlovales sp. CCMP2436]|nr:hypothetical protein T492DRAFT_970674 [Pavlovales sp. CCMP2436]